MKSIAWDGDHPVTAGWRYSSGALHAAYDIGMPRGTRLYSPVDGTVEATYDGVPNQACGTNAGSGSPSNWVLIHCQYKGKPASYLLNHMSPGLKVKAGQKVKAGDYLGNSGNTGNSSCDHLHYVLQEHHVSSGNRYAYLNNNGATSIYEPTKGEEEAMPSANEIAKAVWAYEIDANPGGKPDMQTARKLLRTAANQSSKAADKPSPSAETIWNYVVDQENEKTARQALRETWRKITGRA